MQTSKLSRSLKDGELLCGAVPLPKIGVNKGHVCDFAKSMIGDIKDRMCPKPGGPLHLSCNSKTRVNVSGSFFISYISQS